MAAGFLQIQCGPQHAGCYTHFCSSVLLGYTLGTESHSLKQTQRCHPGSLQRRTHQGPKGKQTNCVREEATWTHAIDKKGVNPPRETYFTCTKQTNKNM